MAGNYLTLHTNDRVVVTTSRGNQEKWFDAEKNLWYKADGGCFEALAEAVSSEVLRNFSKAGTTAIWSCNCNRMQTLRSDLPPCAI